MSEGPPEDTNERVSIGTIVLYALPVGAVLYSQSLLSFFFLKFSTDMLLVGPAAAGTILLVGRLWDAFNDPMVGRLSDRTRTRWGRRRPWFVASAIPLALSTAAIWSPPTSLSENGMVLWLGVSMLAYLTFYSTFRIPHMALGAELTTGYHDRTRVFAGSQLLETFGLVFAAISMGLLETAEDPRATAFQLSIAMAIGTVVLLVTAAATLRERSEHQSAPNESTRAVFRDVLRNPHARILVGVFFFDRMGFSSTIAALPYLADYVVGDAGGTGMYVLGAVISLALGIPLWVALSARVGKQRVWIVALIAKLFVFGGLFFVPLGTESGQAVLMASVFLIGFLSGPTTILGPSLKADVVDWDEAQSGFRREGSYFATWNFAEKSSNALAGWLLGISLAGIGYVANVEQTEVVKTGIRAMTTVAPMLFHMIAIGFLVRFRLDEGTHLAALEEAKAKRASRSDSA